MFQNENGLGTAVISREDFYARQSRQYVEDTFAGSLPAFIAAFTQDAKLTPEVMDGVIAGRMTFQRAFMTGEMTAKGNFKILRMLDTVFNFA